MLQGVSAAKCSQTCYYEVTAEMEWTADRCGSDCPACGLALVLHVPRACHDLERSELEDLSFKNPIFSMWAPLREALWC